MNRSYRCSLCKKSKNVARPKADEFPQRILCGHDGCNGTAWPDDSRAACGAAKSKGWGVVRKCTFDRFHVGGHSWETR